MPGDKIKIAILGSCGTRDVFRLYPDPFDISLYSARSSLISLMARPVPCDIDKIRLESKFQKTSVHNDFTKRFFEKLRPVADDIELLIVDFLEERFDIVEINGSYCTKSDLLEECGILESIPHRVIQRDSPEAIRLWDDALRRFAKKVLTVVSPDKIILHEARAYKLNDDRTPVSEYFRKQADRFNSILDKCYSDFKSATGCLSFCPESRYLNPEHKWGPLSVHYSDEYYKEAHLCLHLVARGSLSVSSARHSIYP